MTGGKDEKQKNIIVIDYNFDHKIQVGELIVNKSAANDVINIFKELYYAGYEPEKERS